MSFPGKIRLEMSGELEVPANGGRPRWTRRWVRLLRWQWCHRRRRWRGVGSHSFDPHNMDSRTIGKSTCAAGETGDHDHNGVDHSGGAGLGGDDHGGAGGGGGGMLESQLPQFQCQARRRCERACTRECEFQEMEGLFYGRWKGGFTSNWVFRADSPRPHAAPAAAGVWVLGCRGAVEGRHSEPPPPVLTGRRRRCGAARNALIDQPVGDGTPRQLASGHNGASIERL
jgi:hypothetical protein